MQPRTHKIPRLRRWRVWAVEHFSWSYGCLRAVFHFPGASSCWGWDGEGRDEAENGDGWQVRGLAWWRGLTLALAGIIGLVALPLALRLGSGEGPRWLAAHGYLDLAQVSTGSELLVMF